MTLRTLDEIAEAGRRVGAALPPLTKQQATRVALILAPHLKARPEAA